MIWEILVLETIREVTLSLRGQRLLISLIGIEFELFSSSIEH